MKNGVSWFLNGYNPQQRLDNYAHVNDGSYGSFLGYFPQYPAETVTKTLELQNETEKLAEAADDLRNGWGAELDVVIYHNDAGTDCEGHAVNLWGYVRSKSDPDGFSYLIVSDSDNDSAASAENRRAAPNKLYACGLTIGNSPGGESWVFSDFRQRETVTLYSVSLLAPWSEDLPMERSGDGNRFANPDLTLEDLNVDTLPGSRLFGRTVLPAGQKLFVQINVNNESEELAAERRGL